MEETKEGFVFDEKRHLYFYDGKPMTGCTTILGILAKPALIPWAAKMATEYVRSELKLTDKWKWSDELPRILEEAKGAHARKRDDAAESGTDLHALVEAWVRACIQENDGYPKVVEQGLIFEFTKWAIKENVRFIATETKLYSKELWVAGTVDMVFEKGGKRFIGDIKTYKKIWDRVPMFQMAGYGIMWREMGNPPVDGHCIICLPKERAFDEENDVMWSFDPEGDEQAFRAAVTLYRALQ